MEVQERPLAVIVGGDEVCCAADACGFEDFLEEGFGLPTRRLDTRSMNLRGLRRALRGLLVPGNTRPLLVVYTGHGGVNGWAPWHARSMSRVTYQELAPLAKAYGGPLLFVNSSCFAMEMVDEFKRRAVPSDRVGVIAACDSNWTAVGGMLLEYVAQSWSAGKVFRPGYMAEGYLLEADKKHPRRVEWFYGLSYSLRQLWRNKAVRRWYALRAAVRPLEHATFFSKRWGAPLDDMVLRHRVVRPAQSLEQEVVVEFMRILPQMQEVLVRLQPPRP